jgi:hypothetical protein
MTSNDEQQEKGGFVLTEKGVSIFFDGKVHTVGRDHARLDEIKEHLRAGEWREAVRKIDLVSTVEDFGEGDLTVRNGQVYFRGEHTHGSVARKVLSMLEEGFSVSPLRNFLEKVNLNPSATARRELYMFAEANGFIIHEDGDLVAYKGVTNDYLDCHSRTISNRVGEVVEMERGLVDDRREVTCSFGLHVGAFEHARMYGQRLLYVKVHPKDVVSIPSDYNNEKMRCCRYEIVGEAEGVECEGQGVRQYAAIGAGVVGEFTFATARWCDSDEDEDEDDWEDDDEEEEGRF